VKPKLEVAPKGGFLEFLGIKDTARPYVKDAQTELSKQRLIEAQEALLVTPKDTVNKSVVSARFV
jgi:hypothetical protein